MLAAIPSVILGLWGIFVIIPWLRDYPFPLLKRLFGWTPFFTGPIYGTSMLAGGIIIAIMILPIITSVSGRFCAVFRIYSAKPPTRSARRAGKQLGSRCLVTQRKVCSARSFLASDALSVKPWRSQW